MNWRSLKSSIPALSPVGLGALVADSRHDLPDGGSHPGN